MQRSKRNGGKEDCAGGEAGTTGEGKRHTVSNVDT